MQQSPGELQPDVQLSSSEQQHAEATQVQGHADPLAGDCTWLHLVTVDCAPEAVTQLVPAWHLLHQRLQNQHDVSNVNITS